MDVVGHQPYELRTNKVTLACYQREREKEDTAIGGGGGGGRREGGGSGGARA